MGQEAAREGERPETQVEAPEPEAAPAEHADAEAPGPEVEIQRLKAQLMRARADYENLQRRVEREREVERDRVKARVLEDFLQVYEYGRMAAQEAERTPGALAEGVRMVVREFDRLLEGQGVRPVGQEGDVFDPTRHEAVADGPGPEGQVLRVVSPGYLLGDRVLRYARVVVGAAATTADGEEE